MKSTFNVEFSCMLDLLLILHYLHYISAFLLVQKRQRQQLVRGQNLIKSYLCAPAELSSFSVNKYLFSSTIRDARRFALAWIGTTRDATLSVRRGRRRRRRPEASLFDEVALSFCYVPHVLMPYNNRGKNLRESNGSRESSSSSQPNNEFLLHTPSSTLGFLEIFSLSTFQYSIFSIKKCIWHTFFSYRVSHSKD